LNVAELRRNIEELRERLFDLVENLSDEEGKKRRRRGRPVGLIGRAGRRRQYVRRRAAGQ